MNILKKLLALIIFGLALTAHSNERDVITIKGNHLHVNNEMYFMKGLCYHPVPKGETARSFYNLDQDLALMVEAGVNTIRVYEPIDDKKVLDKLDAAGIKLIISCGYNNPKAFDNATGGLIEYIQKYKDHNAILLWE